MQDILQRFYRDNRKPGTATFNKRLEELLATISRYYFDALVEFETDKLINLKQISDKEQSNESGRMDYLRLFKDELAAVLRKKYPEKYAGCKGITVTNDLLQHYFETHKSPDDYETLDNALKIIFRKPGEPATTYFMWAYLKKDIPTCITYALQSIFIVVPHIRSTFRDYGVSTDVRKCLEQNLLHLEKIRVDYNITAPLQDIDSARRVLEVEIARANKTLWLPFKPLIMAPLSKADDLCFDVRNLADEENLARQIIKNDGVILVTGYRGVGKSTFVEATLARIPPLDIYQSEKIHRKIVKIQINVAKSTSTFNILRQCLREVCHTLIGKPVEFKEQKKSDEAIQMDKPLLNVLNEDEKQFIKWANLRAFYKVSLQKDESIASLRHIETALGVKPSDLVPKPYNTGWSLSFGMNANKEWSNKVDRTIAMLDYDEDQAEDDLIHIIEMLSRPRKLANGQIVSVKLAFIFDEMDKLSQDLQVTMVEQLKTLFLTRNAVFLLVTSKEFHYLWLNEQKKEDAVLGSYFSSIILVPLFTASITKRLLKKLIWFTFVDKDGLAILEKPEDDFVDTLANYLTYRAKGLPRDIFRLVQEMLEWFPESLQPFLTNNPKQKIKIDMYAEIERKLESFIGVADEASGSTLTIAPELFWMDAQLRDHVQRGLYTLIDEVLSRTHLEITNLNFAGKVADNIRDSLSDASVLETLYQNNFQMVYPSQFNDLMKKLCKALLDVPLGNEMLFLQEDTTYRGQVATSEVPGYILKVSPAYYQIFGPPAVATGSDSQIVILTIPQIERLLKDSDQISRIRALNALSQYQQEEFTEQIQMSLYHIFLTEGEENSLPAASLLGGRMFLEMAVRVEENEETKELIHTFIREQPEGPILLKCFDLIDDALNYQAASSASSVSDLPVSLIEKETPLLLEVLERSRNNLSLAGGIVTWLAKNTNNDVLEDVIKNLNNLVGFSDDFCSLLITLGKHSEIPVIIWLIDYDFQKLSSTTIDVFLDQLNSNQIPMLWSYAMKRRTDNKLAREVMVALLQRLPTLATDLKISTGLQELVLAWLNLPTSSMADEGQWNTNTDIDISILKEALANSNTPLLDMLKTLVSRSDSQPEYKLAQMRLNTALGIEMDNTSASPVPSKPTPRWIILTLALSAAALMGVYMVVPWDLPAQASLVYHIVARLLELYFIGVSITGAITLLFYGDNFRGIRKFYVIMGSLTGFSALGFQIQSFPLVPTSDGQSGLIGLLALAAIIIFIEIRILKH